MFFSLGRLGPGPGMGLTKRQGMPATNVFFVWRATPDWIPLAIRCGSFWSHAATHRAAYEHAGDSSLISAVFPWPCFLGVVATAVALTRETRTCHIYIYIYIYIHPPAPFRGPPACEGYCANCLSQVLPVLQSPVGSQVFCITSQAASPSITSPAHLGLHITYRPLCG